MLEYSYHSARIFCDSLDMKCDATGLMSLLLSRVLFLEQGQLKRLLED